MKPQEVNFQKSQKFLLWLHVTEAAGFTSKRFAHQVTHNRTVNLSGGAGHNLSTDTFMDIMNQEFRGENTVCSPPPPKKKKKKKKEIQSDFQHQ